jgi:hypothetical protein
MVNNSHNYYVIGFYPLSGILESRERNVSEAGSVSVLRVETSIQLGLLERTSLIHRTLRSLLITEAII